MTESRYGTWLDGRPLDSRVVSAGAELTPLDLSYLGRSIRDADFHGARRHRPVEVASLRGFSLI
jgi:hypothetical protein